jgi:hypothetical protein
MKLTKDTIQQAKKLINIKYGNNWKLGTLAQDNFSNRIVLINDKKQLYTILEYSNWNNIPIPRAFNKLFEVLDMNTHTEKYNDILKHLITPKSQYKQAVFIGNNQWEVAR